MAGTQEELTIDDEYKNIRIKIGDSVIATQDVISSVTINYGCTDGSAPAFGSAYSPNCNVEINDNDIVSMATLSAIRMGVSFTVECELETGTYTNMGTFEINSPVQYTDDYSITFSGEGLLGSKLARKKMNWDNMKNLSTNSKKGILTVSQAIGLIQTQFGISVQLPPTQYRPPQYEKIRIVVPMNLNKWKKKAPFKKQFNKLTAREFLQGIAVMLGGNVVEFGGNIKIISLFEASANDSITENYYFTGDSYVADYQSERIPYAIKSAILNTYETTPVQSKKKGSSSSKTYGYCLTTECSCGSVYLPDESATAHEYDVYIDCQWIGRSFEAFYFNDGAVDGQSGIFEDWEPFNFYPSSFFQFVPCTFDFSGWNNLFAPSNFVRVKTIRKNTSTQEETEVEILAYISDMTFSWDGAVSVQISSSYSGDSSDVHVMISGGDVSSVSEAWNTGTDIPEYAIEEEPEPIEGDWNTLGVVLDDSFGFVRDNKIHFVKHNNNSSFSYKTFDGNSTETLFQGNLPVSNPYYIYGFENLNNETYMIGVSRDPSNLFLIYKWNGESWQIEYEEDGFYFLGKSFVLNGLMHILLVRNDVSSHYTWDGNTFNYIEEVHFGQFQKYPSGTVYDNKFHYAGWCLFEGYSGNCEITYDGERWEFIREFDDIYRINSIGVYKNELYYLIYYKNNGIKFLKDFHEELIEASPFPYSFPDSSVGFALELNDKIYLLYYSWDKNITT